MGSHCWQFLRPDYADVHPILLVQSAGTKASLGIIGNDVRIAYAGAQNGWDDWHTLHDNVVRNPHARIAVSHAVKRTVMLVTFFCPAYANITMFGDVAIRLLKMMGHSGTVPSALLASDVPAALKRLQAAVATNGRLVEPQGCVQVDNDEPVVSLRHRALPLIDLLKVAAKAERNVVWDIS